MAKANGRSAEEFASKLNPPEGACMERERLPMEVGPLEGRTPVTDRGSVESDDGS